MYLMTEPKEKVLNGTGRASSADLFCTARDSFAYAVAPRVAYVGP
jgi:hypothetical protein